MPMPYAPPEWWRQRDTSRRNRKIIDLQMGFRLHYHLGDEEKCREIDRKIKALERKRDGFE